MSRILIIYLITFVRVLGFSPLVRTGQYLDHSTSFRLLLLTELSEGHTVTREVCCPFTASVALRKSIFHPKI